MPKNGLLPEVKIVILVIVRWNDKGGLISDSTDSLWPSTPKSVPKHQLQLFLS